MTKPFADTETDRTKSKWLAKTYQDFVKDIGRSKTTLRALFYYALQRNVSDYPICGYFVGEIRVTRPYHESDGEKLPKWMSKAKKLGFIPADAILDESPGESLFRPEIPKRSPYSIEVWLNKSVFNPLLYPICEEHGVTLVSVAKRPSENVIEDFFSRLEKPTIIICLSDLSPSSAFFAQDLATKIEELNPNEGSADIMVKPIGLRPEQVIDFKIPQIKGGPDLKGDRSNFKKYLKPYALDPKKIAELDALEIYCPGGIAGFLDRSLSQFKSGIDQDTEKIVAGFQSM